MTLRQKLFACATVSLTLAGPAWAGPNDILIGLDSKITYTAQGQTNVKPGTDQVLVLDVTDAKAPKVRATLDLSNSLLGPPNNLGITPDGHLGLVASSVTHVAQGDGWKPQPDDKLFVVDLDATPPKLIDTVAVGKQPSGMAIARDGKLALIANRAGKSVSVVSIDGKTVKHVGDVELGQEAAAVAIAPDGKRAFAVMNLANKVAVLEIDGQKVTYDKANDISSGFNPYNIAITPDGKYAVASNTGAGKDNVDALVTIATTGKHPHVAELTTVGVGPEGLAISPDGKWLVTPLLRGSAAKHADYFFTKDGQAVLATIGADGRITVRDRAALGGLPEGVAFSPDSQFVYIGNYIDKNLQVFRIAGGKLESQGEPLPLPGQPASMGGPTR